MEVVDDQENASIERKRPGDQILLHNTNDEDDKAETTIYTFRYVCIKNLVRVKTLSKNIFAKEYPNTSTIVNSTEALSNNSNHSSFTTFNPFLKNFVVDLWIMPKGDIHNKRTEETGLKRS